MDRARYHEVAQWSRKVRRVIVLGSGLLALLYGFLTLKALPYALFINGVAPGILMKVVSAFYFSCWVSGLTHDTDMQADIYTQASFHGRVRTADYCAMLIIPVLAAVLFWSLGNIHIFSVALTTFLIANVVGWRHLLRTIEPAIELTRQEYKSNGRRFHLIILDTVAEYLFGSWQWYRFGAMFVIVAALDLVALVPDFGANSATVLHSLIGNASAPAIMGLFPSVLFLAFCLVGETWIWYHRFRVDAIKCKLESMSTEFRLEVLKSSQMRSAGP